MIDLVWVCLDYRHQVILLPKIMIQTYLASTPPSNLRLFAFFELSSPNYEQVKDHQPKS